MRTIVLVGNSKDQFFRYIENNDKAGIYNLYNINSITRRIIRKAFSTFDRCPSFLFGEWKQVLDNCDFAILSDETVDSSIIRYLKKRNIRTVFWFRNSLNAVDYKKASIKHIKHAKLCDGVVSFDKNDCERMGYTYIENCYYSKKESDKDRDDEYDVVFLGADKSRLDTINAVVRKLYNLKLNNWIYIYSRTRQENEYIKNVYYDYDSYIDIVRKSSCILDIVDNSYQCGYTLRVLEALFYKKKLLTNMKMIKEEAFYDENNIYVFDENEIESLSGFEKFLTTDYRESSGSAIEKFNFFTWVQNIRDLFNR